MFTTKSIKCIDKTLQLLFINAYNNNFYKTIRWGRLYYVHIDIILAKCHVLLYLASLVCFYAFNTDQR